MAGNFFCDNIKKYFFRNKTLIFWFATMVFLAFIVGVFCTLNSNKVLDINFIQDFCLKQFFLQKYSIFGFVSIKILLVFAIFIALFMLSFLKIGNLFAMLFCCYLGFLIGIDCCVVVVSFGLFKGLLLSIFIIFICEVSLVFLLIFFSTQMHYKNNGIRCYGKSILSGDEGRVYLFYLLLATSIIVLQGILLAIICKIFVF